MSTGSKGGQGLAPGGKHGASGASGQARLRTAPALRAKGVPVTPSVAMPGPMAAEPMPLLFTAGGGIHPDMLARGRPAGGWPPASLGLPLSHSQGLRRGSNSARGLQRQNLQLLGCRAGLAHAVLPILREARARRGRELSAGGSRAPNCLVAGHSMGHRLM